MSENLFDTTCNARDKLYSSIGEVEPDVMAHIINPAFMGGPTWPALRQAFSTIHRGENTIVISNGLADPFDDVEEKNSGFGIEIYAETKEPIQEKRTKLITIKAPVKITPKNEPKPCLRGCSWQ